MIHDGGMMHSASNIPTSGSRSMTSLAGRSLGCMLAFAAYPAADAAVAQERPQKGVSAGAIERQNQMRSGGEDVVSTQDRLNRRDSVRAALSPEQLTRLFKGLDRNGDLRLSRSELASLPGLRARFAEYDLDHDHRLDYSEFGHYADTLPDDIQRYLDREASP
ncbi:EF-hand domain-containing protein [Rhodanobacter sp. PCA2]|uniref:EF-hand domain-containing protein n=1 Tax=Rhodanobacter sp. PCA2 TaxID=2006117 RepID=UPI0015E6E935|nr:EF-hand domain-containing protein [Rhodanobacter sp. PCA2]